MLATLLVATVAIIVGWIRPITAVPDPSEVLSMRAGLYDEGGKLNASDVPRQQIRGILAELSPAIRDERPMKWQVLGRLELTCTWGRHVTIDLFQTQEGLGAFRVGNGHHVYYRGGSAFEIEQAIKRAGTPGSN